MLVPLPVCSLVPLFVHSIDGGGFPFASHVKLRSLPSSTSTVVLDRRVIFGETERKMRGQVFKLESPIKPFLLVLATFFSDCSYCD